MDTASASDSGIEAPARWSLRLFGGFELSALPGGEKVAALGTRERALLACLALSPKGSQPRRKLATLLWGDATDETLLDNLRTSLWRLRKALGDSEHGFIASDGEDIVLDVSAFEVDVLAFRRLAAQAGRSELEAAASLYAGELLDGLEIESEDYESWRRAEATRCRDQAVDVLTRLMAQLAECGESERAIETGLKILRLEPLHEAAIRRLMRLYGESGRRGAAVQLYRTLADSLKTELAAQPEAETRAVFAEIARGGEDITAPAAPAAPAAANAKPAALSPVMTRPSDSPIRPAFQWRAALAVLAGVLIVAIVSIGLFVAERARVGPAAVPAGTFIAVLPFANMSGDATQEFFSDGMSEEINAALAKVPDLTVIGRTSAFQFKGQNKDLRTIGQALGASYLIEGSVRKAGDRVRITAQLVRTDNGAQLWSENYDRQLTDIFATQEDIAQAIVAALKVPLGFQQGKLLVSNRTIGPESYQDYLRARTLVRTRQPMQATDAIGLLEGITAHDPDYAPAWALLALAYDVQPQDPALYSGAVAETHRSVANFLPKAEAAARRAIQLDANLADGYASLGRLQVARGNLLLADESYSKALALDANNPDALHFYANLLAEVGRLKESLAAVQRLRTIEPFPPVFIVNGAVVVWLNGQSGAAIATMEALPPIAARAIDLSEIYASTGRFGQAADQLLKIPAGTFFPGIVPEAARLLRSAPATTASTQAVPHLGRLGFAYLYVGAPVRALEFHEASVDAGYIVAITTAVLWHSSYSQARKTERFKALARKAGLVDYWRAKGWPDLCHPTTADDFACE